MITVVYYTSNRENPRFEMKIRKTLRNNTKGFKIISVSQKPISLGKNICVGDVGVSSQNAFRQLLIGAKESDTPFVCTAESDYLYPREYFRFRPRRTNVAYLATPIWMLINRRGFARVFYNKPRGSEAAMIIGRDCLIRTLEKTLYGLDEWGPYHANGEHFPYPLSLVKKHRFIMKSPAVTFKTDNNMHRLSPINLDSKTREVPFWGTAETMIQNYAA